ncbi:MAG: mechanosensitive ion channel domain-containing protein [Halodesulfurarchaeum sp.]
MYEWVRSIGVEFQYLVSAGVLVIGFVGGYLLGRINHRILRTAGVPDAIESTSLERTARKFGTDTVSIVARATAWIIYAIAILVALEVADIVETALLLTQVATLLPSYLLAIAIAIAGLLLADKAEVLINESLRGVKVPQVNLAATFVRYTVVFVAILLALAQIGIAVGALLILLGAYLLALVVFAVVAFHQLLIAGATGLYIVLHQPYTIGDRIAVGDREGVVQEITLFVTHVEADGHEFIIPNHLVFREGAALLRD